MMLRMAGGFLVFVQLPSMRTAVVSAHRRLSQHQELLFQPPANTGNIDKQKNKKIGPHNQKKFSLNIVHSKPSAMQE